MGSDNLHHKRKQQNLNDLKRKITKREQHDVVLMVCEGKKSEPNYLQAYCDELQLNSANIKVLGTGTDPLTLVNRALNEYNQSKDYDRVFCLFDKDKHPNYQDAVNKINSLRERSRNSVPIYAITSVPCFEYWLLLHFVISTRPYIKNGKKSAGDQLFSEIKSYIKDYHKGHTDIFEKTKFNLNIAITRAKQIYEQQLENGTDNPSTRVYELIEYLSKIKNNHRN